MSRFEIVGGLCLCSAGYMVVVVVVAVAMLLPLPLCVLCHFVAVYADVFS